MERVSENRQFSCVTSIQMLYLSEITQECKNKSVALQLQLYNGSHKGLIQKPTVYDKYKITISSQLA